MSWVRPGVELVRARPGDPSKLFIKLDLPTLDRPINASSVSRPDGKCSGEVALFTTLALVIFNLNRRAFKSRTHAPQVQGLEVEVRRCLSLASRCRDLLVGSRSLGSRPLSPDRHIFWNLGLDVRLGYRPPQRYPPDLADEINPINGHRLPP